jgi:hypothetical protein
VCDSVGVSRRVVIDGEDVGEDSETRLLPCGLPERGVETIERAIARSRRKSTLGRGQNRRHDDVLSDHPIAEKLVAKMKRDVRGTFVNLKDVITGRAAADALQRTVATKEDLAGFDPAHAAYVYAQNHVSVMSEQLTALEEMAPLVDLVSQAEDLYMPSGPPMSPLTTSYFTCWAYFDACVGSSNETIGTAVLDVGAAFGMDSELLRLIRLMQGSRMGLYTCEGANDNLVVLREFVTDTVRRAVVPSGYRGRRGELWYARVFPTPYIVLEPGPREWQAYFGRTVPEAPQQVCLDAYERHMKYGPTRTYWNDFVFEGYVNHRTEAIYLAGLPDVPQSRPHSEVNSR